MKQYVEKLLQARTDLRGKIKKAKSVIETVPYGMDKKQIILLAEQINAMDVYLNCLDERIKYENEKE